MRPIHFALILAFATSFFPQPKSAEPPRPAPCDPSAQPFQGYTFLYPDIVNRKAAYAPYFLQFSGLYDKYFQSDIQRDDNLAEWNERFCGRATPADVAQIVYETSPYQLEALLAAAGDETQKSPLPTMLAANPFAQVLAFNGCTEAIEYLIFARRCEPHVSGKGGWDFKQRDTEAMQLLVEEGLSRFKQARSHFFRLRYAYQVVRLAHYRHDWQQTVDLYNRLLPQIDRRKPSIIFYWTLGHLAGALQKLGKYAEAAHRYALIFKNCPSKRTQAFRSFRLRDDADWQKTMQMAQSDGEKATLLALRAGVGHAYAVEDMETIYELEPANPTLDLLLVSDIQQLEKHFLRTPVTDRKYGLAQSSIRRDAAAKHLLDLQKLVRRIVKEEQNDNPTLWALLEGYLFLLAGDEYAAEKSFDRAEEKLQPDNPETNDQAYARQIEIWRTLLQIRQLDQADRDALVKADGIRGQRAFKEWPSCEPFLLDWLSTLYAESKRPGKAFMAAYDLKTLALNPTLPVLDDLLDATQEQVAGGIEYDLVNDSNTVSIKSKVLEIRGMYFFALGEPEAALASFREIPETDRAYMKKFSPFKLYIRDCLTSCQVPDPSPLNRLEIVERLRDLEFEAKAAAAGGDAKKAAQNYYLIGLALYNMSWFGYEWEAFDEFRDGDNWYRLAKGPIFPLAGAPYGNRENLDLRRALGFLEKALEYSRDGEFSVKIAFVAAKCQQKMWFSSAECKYRPGARQIPLLPAEYNTYYNMMKKKYAQTEFYGQVVKECKWFAAYAR